LVKCFEPVRLCTEQFDYVEKSVKLE